MSWTDLGNAVDGRRLRVVRQKSLSPRWVDAMFRSGRFEAEDIAYAATEFPAAVIDAHFNWHAPVGGVAADLATCQADLCRAAVRARPLLALVAGEARPS